MFINYRYYTIKEIIEALSRERIYFSRRNSAIQQPDVITLDIVEDGQVGGGVITISCEVNNNCEDILEILEKDGFLQAEESAKYYKSWIVSFKLAQDPRKLLDDIVASLNEALESAPLDLYASPTQKTLEDYHCFMKSNVRKVGYHDIMKYLGYSYEECVSDENNLNSEIDYMIARYRNDRWGAWISGDLIVPLFPSEHEARSFLKKRAKHIFYKRSITVKTVLPIGKSRSARTYILADSTASRQEKIEWLQRELERLQGFNTGYHRDSHQSGKAVFSAAN